MLLEFLLSAAMASGHSSVDTDELPRRGSLEIALAPTESGDLQIVGFRPDSRAPDKGLVIGDRIVSIRNIAINSQAKLFEALSGLTAGVEYDVTYRRGLELRSVMVEAVPRPTETIGQFDAKYGHVTIASGDRIRTIFLYPADTAIANSGGLPAVFYVHGIPCQALDGLEREGVIVNSQLKAMLEAGFVVGFAEKPGLGDSEGIDCQKGGFDREVEAYSLAARMLSEEELVDPSRVFMVGVSMGGFQAPLISKSVDFAGIVTVGTGLQPWFDYLITNFRWRYQLENADASQTEERLRLFRRVWAAVLVFGLTEEDLKDRYPEDARLFKRYFGDIGSAFGGRSVRFFQELDRAELWPSWTSFRGDLLALHGEYDWVATEYDHRMISKIVQRNSPSSLVEFAVLPGLDHAGTRHDSLEDSFSNRFRGERGDVLNTKIVSWLTARARTHE